MVHLTNGLQRARKEFKARDSNYYQKFFLLKLIHLYFEFPPINSYENFLDLAKL